MRATAGTRAGANTSRRWHGSGQTKNCEHCGATYRRPLNQSNQEWERRRFCCMSCSSQHRSTVPVAQRTEPVALAYFPPDQEWRGLARCRGSEVDFAPDSKMEARSALLICQSCPVRAQCLDYGTATRSSGVWGGKWLAYGKGA